MRIGKIWSSAEYRINERFQKFPIWKILEIFILENSKNVQFAKF